MPLARISVSQGKSREFCRAISSGIHSALMEEFNVPKDDLFHVVTEHVPDVGIVRAQSYLGIAYSNDLTLIQITVTEGRSIEQKKKLYRSIARRLSKDPGLRMEDVFVNLLEVKKGNWSFGNGEAQYA